MTIKHISKQLSNQDRWRRQYWLLSNPIVSKLKSWPVLDTPSKWFSACIQGLVKAITLFNKMSIKRAECDILENMWSHYQLWFPSPYMRPSNLGNICIKITLNKPARGSVNQPWHQITQKVSCSPYFNISSMLFYNSYYLDLSLRNLVLSY